MHGGIPIGRVSYMTSKRRLGAENYDIKLSGLPIKRWKSTSEKARNVICTNIPAGMGRRKSVKG